MMPSKFTPEREAALRRLHAEGWNWAEIGREIGVHFTTARIWGLQIGLTISKAAGRKRSWDKLSPEAKDACRAQLVANCKLPRATTGMAPAQRDNYRALIRAGYSKAEALGMIQNPEHTAVTSRPCAGRAAHPPRAGATSPGGRGQSPAGGLMT
jgi:hypothetical protein